jgi:hypothetical protein
MINPFKYTYRITEHSDPDGVWYEVEYGNFLSRDYLCRDGIVKSYSGAYIHDNYEFPSIDDAKKAIEDHLTAKLTTELKSRLNKPTSKAIQYV